ncbi:MAG: ankyrin repeat domain-containing protein [Burkholderiaceae bacterium]
MRFASAKVPAARPGAACSQDCRLSQAVLAADASAIGAALLCGADANARGPQETTPLMVAVDRQKSNAVNALLRAGADPNAMACDRNTPVSLAVESYRAQPDGRRIWMAVLEGGGDPTARRPDGDPVIMRFILDHAKPASVS